jgi:uncharacterized protein YggE
MLAFPFFGESQTLNIPLLEISQSEIAYAQVDEIHFTIVIQKHAKEISDARNQNREVAESVFKYLKSKGIPDRYIQTKRMTISRNVIRNRHPVEYDGFNAYQQIYVCLKDFESYDEIVDNLLVMDIHSLNGPSFQSSQYQELHDKAKLEALKKAKVRAEELAAALGQSIGKAKLIKVDTKQNYSTSAYSSQNTGSSSNGGNTSFEIGEIEIKAWVTVSFELF